MYNISFIHRVMQTDIEKKYYEWSCSSWNFKENTELLLRLDNICDKPFWERSVHIHVLFY